MVEGFPFKNKHKKKSYRLSVTRFGLQNNEIPWNYYVIGLRCIVKLYKIKSLPLPLQIPYQINLKHPVGFVKRK